MMNARILLVDDHAILLDGLEAILSAEASYKVVGKVTDGRMGLAYLKSTPIDIVVIDYNMPEMDGLQFLTQVKKEYPGVKVVILSMHDEPHIIKGLLTAGADGYVLKKYAQKEIFMAIEAALSGRQYWSQEVSRALLKMAHEPADEDTGKLTPRELEVLKLIADQLSTRDIANRLFLSERTVETHRKNLMRKTKSSNTAGLIKYAFAKQLLS
jgi:two-component system, NarL family, nitrate/nitrite response regulator NarL